MLALWETDTAAMSYGCHITKFSAGVNLAMDIFFEAQSYTENSAEEAQVLDWYKMSPAERFVESQKLWEVFMLLGGDYDPEPDTQSPFHIFQT